MRRLHELSGPRLDGIGKELSQSQWSSVYRQLVAGGFLESDIEAYGGLKLTEAAKPVLKGTQEVWLRRDAEPISKVSKAPAKV